MRLMVWENKFATFCLKQLDTFYGNPIPARQHKLVNNPIESHQHSKIKEGVNLRILSPLSKGNIHTFGIDLERKNPYELTDSSKN